jgi:hypothetical protein
MFHRIATPHLNAPLLLSPQLDLQNRLGYL